MLILAVDTSAVACSCAILKEDKVLAEFFVNNKLNHSVNLLPMIENALNSCNIKPSDVDYFAVSQGPGSFTGLRIGISTIKGLCFTFQKECCVGVSGLEALAINCINYKGIICACMDARCEQVYNAIFESDGEKITRLCEDRAVSIKDLEEDLIKKYKKNLILVGDGANLCYNSFNQKENIVVAALNNMFLRASSVAIVAKKFLDDGGSAAFGEDLSPVYLRLPQAMREKGL